MIFISSFFSWWRRIADHDLRREAIRRQRSQARGELHLHAYQEMNTQLERVAGEIEEGEEVNGDLAGVLHHLARSYLACTAKAA